MEHGVKPEAVKLLTAKRGLAPSPRRRVIGRSFGRAQRFRRLALAHERSPEIHAGLRYVVFVILMLKNVAEVRA
jgi:transposase